MAHRELTKFFTTLLSRRWAETEFSQEFAETLASAERGTLGTDYLGLRRLYTKEPAYLPYPYMDRAYKALEVGVIPAAKSGDLDTLKAHCHSLLSLCPLDLKARYFLACAESKSGNSEEARVHARMYDGLRGSIFSNADGESPETAYEVICSAERREVMMLIRFEPERNCRVFTHNGLRYELNHGKSGGKRRRLIFLVDSMIAAGAFKQIPLESERPRNQSDRPT